MTRDRNHRQPAMSGDKWEIIRVARSTARSPLHLTITTKSKVDEGRIMINITTGPTETNFLQTRLDTNQIIIEEVANESDLTSDLEVTRIAADVGPFHELLLHEIVIEKVDTSMNVPTPDPSMNVPTADQSTRDPTVDPLMIGPLNSIKKIRLLQVGAMTPAATKLRLKATMTRVQMFRLLYRDRPVRHCPALLSLLLLPPPDQLFAPLLHRRRLGARSTDGATKGRWTTQTRLQLT